MPVARTVTRSLPANAFRLFDLKAVTSDWFPLSKPTNFAGPETFTVISSAAVG